ncbi:hypothetical protein H4S03_008552 [Coemansia sp. S3946]|nr:hypothetical protein H4S03_008552 [Coemansia sp. S3946]
MRRLHTDYLDIVLCHDVEFVDIAQIVDVALPKLLELKQQGLVRKLRAAGVETVIAASPLSMGLLSDGETPEWHPAKSELKNAVKQCIDLVRSCNEESKISLAEIAESYAFSYGDVDVHLVGAKTAQEVEHAFRAYTHAQKLQLFASGKYEDDNIQNIYAQIKTILEPFAEYTWPSPPGNA